MKKSFLEKYHQFIDDAKEINDKILLDFKNTGKEFATQEVLSLWVSECLIEDIDTIQHLKEKGFSNRVSLYHETSRTNTDILWKKYKNKI
ncbi:MAG: hypothetical protein NC347_05805 [Clostridium sp.]|nr:hypothetical protein [Clostridium sp.]